MNYDLAHERTGGLERIDADAPAQGADLHSAAPSAAPDVPAYLTTHYWWAYIHPRAIRFFERQWLINLILWGNYRRLSEAALAALDLRPQDAVIQIACAYGDLTMQLVRRVEAVGGHLDVIDVVLSQLANLAAKIPASMPHLACMDAQALDYPENRFDAALLFFLLHEQPADVRRRTLEEAYRVLKPGGRLVIVDYALPAVWNPVRLPLYAFLARVEPFAPDLWVDDVRQWLPSGLVAAVTDRRRYYGGLYQVLTLRKPDCR